MTQQRSSGGEPGYLSGFETPYDWERAEPYSIPEFFGMIEAVVDRYFYGFYHPLGRRLIEGQLSDRELRFLATQELPYYDSTTWWNAGKLAQSDTLEQQRLLHGPLLDELGQDLITPSEPTAHSRLFMRYCEGLGLREADVRRAPLAPGVVLAVTELRRMAQDRPVFEFLAASNLVVERMRPRHYRRLLEAFDSHYRWVPKEALFFYELHAKADVHHESLGRRVVSAYLHDRRDQDAVFSAVLRSLCLRLMMYDSIAQAMSSGGVGLIPWPNFPREPWPRPRIDVSTGS